MKQAYLFIISQIIKKGKSLSLRTGNKKPLEPHQPGFTIVELLIVIVVIAILAAISVVAYSGIQDRANRSSAQSAAAQAAKSVALYYAQHETYPSNLAAANITSTDGLQYRVDNTANPKTYCITSTTANRSYFVSSTTTAPTEGGCPGHGTGGVAAVTNHVSNPAVHTTSGWTRYNVAGGESLTRISNAHGSRAAWRLTAGAAGFSVLSSNGYEHQGTNISVTAGEIIYPSIWMRSNKSGNFSLLCYFSSGSGSPIISYCPQSIVAVSANEWVRLGGDAVTVPPTADRMSIRAEYKSGTTWQVNDWWDVTMASTAPGVYADGESDGWVWNGTPNASSSTGPRLP